MKYRKLIIGLFIFWHLGNLFVEGFPPAGKLHGALHRYQAWYINTLGQWQGSFAFFAPDPLKDSVRIEASFRFKDGSNTHWESPDWSKLSLWQKFLSARLVKFYDNVRMDDFSDAWNGFALSIARPMESPPRHYLATANLTRVWSTVPPPVSPIYNVWARIPATNRYTFFRRSYE